MVQRPNLPGSPSNPADASTPSSTMPDSISTPESGVSHSATIERAKVNPKGQSWEKNAAAAGLDSFPTALHRGRYVPMPTSQKEYDALGLGDSYMGPDGQMYKKGNNEPKKPEKSDPTEPNFFDMMSM